MSPLEEFGERYSSEVAAGVGRRAGAVLDALALGFRPILDRIIVRRDAAPEMIGSIHLAESTQGSTDMKAQTGVVLMCGQGLKPNKPLIPLLTGGKTPEACYFSDVERSLLSRGEISRHSMAVSPGDRVVFSRYTGGDIPGHPGCIILREADVLAVIDPETQAMSGNAMKGRYTGIDKSIR